MRKKFLFCITVLITFTGVANLLLILDDLLNLNITNNSIIYNVLFAFFSFLSSTSLIFVDYGISAELTLNVICTVLAAVKISLIFLSGFLIYNKRLSKIVSVVIILFTGIDFLFSLGVLETNLLLGIANLSLKAGIIYCSVMNIKLSFEEY